jgi:hypothetical protein
VFILLMLYLIVISRWWSSWGVHRGCVLLSSGGDLESSVSVSPPTRAHTLSKQKKKKKKNSPSISIVVETRWVVTYGIRAGSTRDLGFATAFVDMSWFYYTVADRVDCVRAR